MNDESPWLHDGTYRARWMREVLRSPSITDSVRVLLLTCGLHMDASGRVSVPRDVLAELLGRSERKVGDKVRTAMDSGFLVQIVRGQKYQTAVYQAAVNGEPLRGTRGGPAENSQGDPGGPAEPNLSRTPGGPAENSQGDGFKHPENSQQDGSAGPPGVPLSVLSRTPGGPPICMGGVDVGDSADVNDGSLFVVEDAASRLPTRVGGARASRRRPEAPIPPDFAVTPAMRADAKAKGYTVDLDRETYRFINHANAKGRRCRDWIAAWRNWIDKAQEFADRDAQRAAPARPTSGPMATSDTYTEEDIWK